MASRSLRLRVRPVSGFFWKVLDAVAQELGRRIAGSIAADVRKLIAWLFGPEEEDELEEDLEEEVPDE